MEKIVLIIKQEILMILAIITIIGIISLLPA